MKAYHKHLSILSLLVVLVLAGVQGAHGQALALNDAPADARVQVEGLTKQAAQRGDGFRLAGRLCVDDACHKAAAANNHNTTRSNKTQPAAADDVGSTAAQDYNSSRSNRGLCCLEHTDDWIAARAASGDSDLILERATTGLPTGRRMHSPIKVTRSVDAATPYLYKARVDADGGFVFENVPPGDYLLFAGEGAGRAYLGHVTVLK